MEALKPYIGFGLVPWIQYFIKKLNLGGWQALALSLVMGVGLNVLLAVAFGINLVEATILGVFVALSSNVYNEVNTKVI